MKKIFGKYPFFLVLLPLFIVLHVEKIYGHLINYGFVTKEILMLFIAPLVIYGISWILVRSLPKTNILSFILLIFFYFSGDFKDSLKAKWPGSFIQSYTFIMPVLLALIIVLFIITKKNTPGKKITIFLNLATLLFVIIDSASLLVSFPGKSSPIQKDYRIRACSDCEHPDIYYIIFDSYSSSSTLKKEFNYDNSAIDNFLKENAFRVIKHSRSNYNLTPFSIGSIFNMKYLDNVDTSHILHLKNYLTAVDKVYYADLLPDMEREGYKIYNHSIFDFKNHKSSVPGFDIWKIKSIYQQFNIIKKVHNEIGWNFPSWLNIRLGSAENYVDNRDKHDSIALTHLLKTITDTSSRPKFVYTHFFLPHSPYSYDSSGHKVPVSYDLTVEEDKQAYVSQLVYANSIMRRIVQAIKAKPGRNSIIIIQGDHGYRFFDATKKSEEFPNLNAIYFPDQDYSHLNDSMSSVNTFRVIFNSFFRQNYPMLPTETHFLKYK